MFIFDGLCIFVFVDELVLVWVLVVEVGGTFFVLVIRT